MYGLNNPLVYTDPSGLRGGLPGCPYTANPIASHQPQEMPVRLAFSGQMPDRLALSSQIQIPCRDAAAENGSSPHRSAEDDSWDNEATGNDTAVDNNDDRRGDHDDR